jgi:hypothetical protein
MSLLSRRTLLQIASAIVPAQLAGWPGLLSAQSAPGSAPVATPPDAFPQHPAEMVREVVLVSHFNEKRLRELVDARPALARAAYDWGFGDWETALGAASHMGNRPIAEYLLSKGARPSLFSAAMLGQLDVVKAFVAAQPDSHRIRGPHSISLLSHAKAGGAAARPVFEYLQMLDGAGEDVESPLTDADRALVVGAYVFGGVPSQQVDITLEPTRDPKVRLLTWTRKGTFGRPLFHLGDRVFHPAGAAATRIRFTEEPDVVVMTVSDPDVLLTARRKKAQA